MTEDATNEPTTTPTVAPAATAAPAVTPVTPVNPDTAAPAPAPGRPPVRRGRLATSLGLLVVIVVLEIAAGPALRPPPEAHPAAHVLALPEVRRLIRDAQADPTEITRIAARRDQPVPSALPAQAVLDGLLLVSAAALGLPRLLRARKISSSARLGLFLGSLAILLGAIAVGVAAIGRLRYFIALYLSPPLGTLSYLLLYGDFRRGGSLGVLAGLMVLKVGACAALFGAYPRALSERGLAGLAVTSVAATVFTTFCYALAPTTMAGITDALAATVVALVAVLWAGVIVSGSVRRLA